MQFIQSITLAFQRNLNYLFSKEVKIIFSNDEKVDDAGGLIREWVTLIFKEATKPPNSNSNLSFVLILK